MSLWRKNWAETESSEATEVFIKREEGDDRNGEHTGRLRFGGGGGGALQRETETEQERKRATRALGVV